MYPFNLFLLLLYIYPHKATQRHSRSCSHSLTCTSATCENNIISSQIKTNQRGNGTMSQAGTELLSWFCTLDLSPGMVGQMAVAQGTLRCALKLCPNAVKITVDQNDYVYFISFLMCFLTFRLMKLEPGPVPGAVT